MQKLLWVLAILSFTDLYAQEPDKVAVQRTIETFFEGFHQQDSLLIKQTVHYGVVLQTIAKDSLGNDRVRTEDFHRFLRSIVGIPKTTRFEEVLKSFSIQVDGPMAHAWTPYEFRLNDVFSHCGVNSFQLFKEGADWKIIYLIDTRHKDQCD